MLRVVRALVFGTAIGAVLGVLARALMRLIAIGMGLELEFNRVATIAIVSLFVVSGAGAAAAGVFGLRTWRLGLVLIVSSAPLLIMGTTFAVGEIDEILDRDFTLPWKVVLLAVSGAIVAAAFLTPYAGWRAGRGKTPRRLV